MRKAAIVIVGGGLLGTSVAYHLARRGARDVVLLERLGLATSASSQAAGLMFTISSKASVDRLSRVTFKAIDALEEQLGEPLDFHRVGCVRFAGTRQNRSVLESLYTRARQEDISAEIVDKKWLAENLPWVTTGVDVLAVYFADDGYIDSYRLASAYARAAKQSGVTMETNVAVKSIVFDGKKTTAVQTSRGVIQCEKVVLAAGAWSNNLTMPLGIPLPMAPVRSHFWITAPGRQFGRNQPMTVHADAGVFTRPEVNGLVLGVQEALSPAFDYRHLPDDISTFTLTQNGHEWDALVEAEPRVSRFFPGLKDAGFESYVTGLSAYTPDGHFILGEIDKKPGLYAAAGCCGSGVMASGGIGEALAGLIIEGASPYDLVPFKPDRFGMVDPASTAFQTLCAKARAKKAE